MSARAWLAKVTSFAFPRTFSTGPLPKTNDGAVLLDAGRHHHVCFTVQITDGTKHAIGREVEVQIQADEAIKLGQQMIRIATALLPAPREGEQTPPTEGDQVT
ncbi:VCBS domain-containing protein [Streptomyces seoulensis]